MKIIALLYDSVLDIGGVESHLLSLIQNRDSSEFSYTLFSRVSQRFQSRIESLGVEVIQEEKTHPLNPIRPINLARVLKQKRVDLIHAHSPTSALWGRAAAYYAKIPAVVTVHLPVDQYHGDQQSLRSKFGRKLYIQLDRWWNHQSRVTKKLIYVSHRIHNRDIAASHSPADRSTIISNGIDLLPFNEVDRGLARNHFSLSPETKVLSFVGRLDTQKNLPIFIDAIRIMILKAPDFRVWLIGEGPERDQLLAQVADLGLSDIVHFWGFQENVPLYLKASDIFVLPSRYEGMPIALLNGMAAGLPCVVTSVGDNERLISHGVHGLVVPPDDPVQLAEALTSLLSDPARCRQMSEAVRKKVSLFSDTDMVLQVEHIYDACLHEK